MGPFTVAALVLLAVVAVAAFAPRWVVATVNRRGGKRQAAYTLRRLGRELRRWLWERTPGGALEALDRKQTRAHRVDTVALDLTAIRAAHAARTDRTEAAA